MSGHDDLAEDDIDTHFTGVPSGSRNRLAHRYAMLVQHIQASAPHVKLSKGLGQDDGQVLVNAHTANTTPRTARVLGRTSMSDAGSGREFSPVQGCHLSASLQRGGGMFSDLQGTSGDLVVHRRESSTHPRYVASPISNQEAGPCGSRHTEEEPSPTSSDFQIGSSGRKRKRNFVIGEGEDA